MRRPRHLGRLIAITVVPLVAAGLLAVRETTARNTAEAGQGASAAALELSVAIPEHRGRRVVVLDSEHVHFHVVLRNTSTEPLRIWRPWCSWGYDALSFEATVNGEDAPRVIQREPVVHKQNTPDWLVLNPGEPLVFDVYVVTDAWRSFPLPEPGEQLRLELRAIYEVDGGDMARKHQIWTGKVASPALTITFDRRPDE